MLAEMSVAKLPASVVSFSASNQAWNQKQFSASLQGLHPKLRKPYTKY